MPIPNTQWSRSSFTVTKLGSLCRGKSRLNIPYIEHPGISISVAERERKKRSFFKAFFQKIVGSQNHWTQTAKKFKLASIFCKTTESPLFNSGSPHWKETDNASNYWTCSRFDVVCPGAAPSWLIGQLRIAQVELLYPNSVCQIRITHRTNLHPSYAQVQVPPYSPVV